LFLVLRAKGNVTEKTNQRSRYKPFHGM
jgi:hypothetical protein